MFANLLHCQSGLAHTDLSGTFMSLDGSTPKTMSKLMALGNKTLHDPVSNNNFITGKLVAILQVGSNWDISQVPHCIYFF